MALPEPPAPVIDEAMIQAAIRDERDLAEKQWVVKDDPCGGLSWDEVVLHKLSELCLSYRGVARVANLQTLNALQTLRLDNNKITQIENLDHLVNLTWLDLSFNKIEVIEGLTELTCLKDLALSHNKISRLQGLATLTRLEVLSIGSNELSSLDDMLYLRKLDSLRAVNLAGNPLASSTEYRSTALAYMPNIEYLDHALIDPQEKKAAVEQDTTLAEVKEADEARMVAREEDLKGQARMLELRQANLGLIAAFTETLFAEDEDGQRLCVFPPIADLQGTYKDKLGTMVLETIDKGLASWNQCAAEVKEVTGVMQAASHKCDEDSRQLVAGLEKMFKRSRRKLEQLSDEQSPGFEASAVGITADLRANSDELKGKLLAGSIALEEHFKALISEFENNYTLLQTARANTFGQFFRAVEKEEVAFKDQVALHLQDQLERFEAATKSEDPSELDMFEEEVRVLLSDRESLLNSVGSSHDAHMSKLLSTEDDVRAVERSRMAEQLADMQRDADRQSRERVAELRALHKHQVSEIEALLKAAQEDY